MKKITILCSMIAVLSLLVTALAWGANEQVLFTFGRSGTPGGVIFDRAGNLYGITADGGTGFGSVFELSPASGGGWTQSILYSFTGGADGNEPASPQRLVFDKHGNLYGTTIDGGKYGLGVVFKLKPQSGGGWTESVIHNFNTPAANPKSGLVFDSAGNLYGVTSETAYQLSRTSGGPWKISILHRFGVEKNDGRSPSAGLFFDSAGNLYGPTDIGGIRGGGNGKLGFGTVFKFTPVSGGGWHYGVIYRFKGGADGDHPNGRLISDSAGNLYGTTTLGGKTGGLECSTPGCGAVFELSPNSNGTYKHSVLHLFAGEHEDGANPDDGVVLDQAGHLLGTTPNGGKFDPSGIIFELTRQSTGWQETVLYNFTGDADGGIPRGEMIFDGAGDIFGTTTDRAVAFQFTP